MNLLVQGVPLADAVQKLGDKTIVGTTLRTSELAQLPLKIREESFFSATVEDARFLETAKAKALKALSMVKEKTATDEAFVDRSSFIGDLRKQAIASGLGTGTDPRNVQDLASRARLGLIYDMQAGKATGFARRKSGLTQGALLASPAWRLVRIRPSRVARKWDALWDEAGVKVGFEGASKAQPVALKTSPIWTALSQFGTPWPPFRFGSGMGVINVGRLETEQLGLLEPGEIPEAPEDPAFNAELSASVEGMEPVTLDVLRNLFGSHVAIEGGSASWAPAGSGGELESLIYNVGTIARDISTLLGGNP